MTALMTLAAYAPPDRDCGGDVNDVADCAGVLPWVGVGVSWGIVAVTLGVLVVIALVSTSVVTVGGSWFERVALGLTPEPRTDVPIPQTAPDDVPLPGTVPEEAPGTAPPQVAPDGVPPPGVPETPGSEPGVEGPEAPDAPDPDSPVDPDPLPLPVAEPLHAEDQGHGTEGEDAEEGDEGDGEGESDSGNDGGDSPGPDAEGADGDALPAEVTALLDLVHALYGIRVRAVEKADAFAGAAAQNAGDAPGRAELAEAAAAAARDAEATAAADLPGVPELLRDLLDSPALVQDDVDVVGSADALAFLAVAVHDGLDGTRRLYEPARELAEAAEAAWRGLQDAGTDEARDAAARAAEAADALKRAVEEWAKAVDDLIATLANRLYRGTYSAATIERIRKGLTNAAPGIKKVEQILTPKTQTPVPPAPGTPQPPVGGSSIATAALVVYAVVRFGYERWRTWWNRRRNP